MENGTSLLQEARTLEEGLQKKTPEDAGTQESPEGWRVIGK